VNAREAPLFADRSNRQKSTTRAGDSVTEDGGDLAAIRISCAWRLQIWALRLVLLAVLCFVGVAVLAAAKATAAADRVGVLAFLALVLGVVIGLVAVVRLTPRSSRYSGVAADAPDPGRLARGLRALILDVFTRRA
jgi:hypothetical protein